MSQTGMGVGGGIASGAMAGGSMFGPVGALAGGVIGGIGGAFASKSARRAQIRQENANIKQSFEMTTESFSSLGEGREQAHKGYDQDMAATRAKFAASGGRLEGTAWDQSSGENVRRRDDMLKDIQFEEDEWRGSDAYAYVKMDYDRMKIGRSRSDNTLRSPDQTVEQRLEYGYRAPKKPFVSHDADNKTYDRPVTNPDRKGYMERITPTLREWEKYRFGTKAEKATYATAMDQRVTKANAWYDGQKAMREHAGRGWREHKAREAAELIRRPMSTRGSDR